MRHKKGHQQAIHFYDSANPAAIPSGVYAAVYVNGFAWPKAQVDRMGKIISVSVEREASWAAKARCIDIESGAAQPEDAVPFIKERRARGFNDGTVYVNRSNRAEVAERLERAHLSALFWVATLDGTQSVEGAWAVQYQGGMHSAFDLSVLHGADNFHRP
jgi:hypothetical protein